MSDASSSSSSLFGGSSLCTAVSLCREAWATFDLDSRRVPLDAAASRSKAEREKSANARRLLSETTKSFKRLVKGVEQGVARPDALTKECRGLVKAYQEEIDSLTRRCRASDANFSGLYQSLYGLPDPAAVLRDVLDYGAAVDARTSDAEAEERATKDVRVGKEADDADDADDAAAWREEVLSLRREVSEYEAEFRALKNQDVRVRTLEATVASLREEAEREIDARAAARETAAVEREGRRAAAALEREAAAERRSAALETELRAERAGRAALERRDFGRDEDARGFEAAWEAQRAVLVDDGERVRAALHEAVAERDALRLRLAATTARDADAVDDGTNDVGRAATAAAYEAELSEMASALSTAREEARRREDAAAAETTAVEARLTTERDAREATEAERDDLRRRLDAAPDVEELETARRELALLRRLEHGADDDDDDNGNGDGNDLESALVARLRRSDADLLRERRARREQEDEIASLRTEIQTLEERCGVADELAARLENDLDRAIASSAAVASSSSAPSPNARPNDVLRRGDEADALRRVLDPDAAAPPVAPAPVVAREDPSSVAAIVVAQRDRLRARCDALEAERDSFKRELQTQVAEADRSRADNARLYEKVRYLQNFGGAADGRRRPPPSDDDLDLGALEARYEASVDPFRQFNRRERDRKMKEMSLLERIVFFSSRVVLANTKMRTGLFFYLMFLHLLVFVTTYHWAHETGCHAHLEDHPGLAHLHHGPPIDESARRAATP